jgi:hypothetical protein
MLTEVQAVGRPKNMLQFGTQKYESSEENVGRLRFGELAK